MCDFKLKRLVLSITNKCNLKCKHCYQKSGKVEYYYLSESMAKKIITEAVELGVKHIVLSGGEPFCNIDLLFSLISYSKERGLFVTITSNGTLINEQNLIMLKELNVDNLQISLDGQTREIHEVIRGENTFNKTVQAIKLAVKLNINVSVMMVLFKTNKNFFKEYCEFIYRLGVRKIGVERFILTGSGKFNNELLVSDLETKEFYKEAREICNNFPLKIHFNDPLYNISLLKDKIDIYDSTKICFDGIGCSAGIEAIYIDEKLRITPCPLMNLEVDIYGENKNLKDIWNNNDTLNLLRNSNEFECGSCKFFEICRGCRAASFVDNTLYSRDPLCFIRNKQGG